MGFMQRLARFFYGRYGIDTLYTGLLVISLSLMVINLFVGSLLLSLLVYILLGWSMFRTFSRNIPARQRENRWFVKFWKKITFGKGKVRGEFQNGRGGYGGYGNGYGSYGGYQNNSGYSDEYSGFGQSAPPPKKKKAKLKTDRDHCFRICPECMANLRLPKKKGKHTVVCPRCKHRFEVKI